MVRALRQQPGFLIDNVAPLLPAFAHLGMFVEDAVHGADRAVIDALVEQRGVDFGGGEIDILRFAQQGDDALPFWFGQCARRGWSRAAGRMPELGFSAAN